MTVTNVAIVGLGKIARDQHVPSIARSDAFELAATVSRNASIDDVPSFDALDTMLTECPDIGAVALCVPPQVRFEFARAALQAGRDVLLEKPPGATLSEIEILEDLARAGNQVLFATWHSRFAIGVAPAKAWLAARNVKEVSITWHEDVRHWHPGQQWIWDAGGLGVFDPGINALSILTEILPFPVRLVSAALEFPSNRQAPIAATLGLSAAHDVGITASFDWRKTGPQIWRIEVITDDGKLVLDDGGAKVTAAGNDLSTGDALQSEYDGIYRRFAALIDRRRSEVDVAPLRLVADAFLSGTRSITDPFND